MTLVVVLIAVAVLVLVVVLFAAFRHGPPISDTDELLAAIHPIDVQAFRNLIDRQEENYLRDTLEPAEFHPIQRERMLAAAQYVRSVAHNASILLRAGQAARVSDNSEIAHAADELVASAIRLRVCSVAAGGLLYVRAALPGMQIHVSDVVEGYARLRKTMLHLSRLQAPAEVNRIEAAL